MNKCLTGKVALVTGARSERGMGYAAALKLAEEGADIVMTTRSGSFKGDPAEFESDQSFEQFRSLARNVEALGVRCFALPMDVTDREQVNRVVDYSCEQLGGIDILFNNAGIGFGELFMDTSPEQFNNAWNINVMGTIHVSQAVIPRMLQRGGGSIINNASIYGLGGAAYVSAYVATKHAIVGLTKSMALELGEQNIRVNAICPGMVVTEMGDIEYQLIADAEGIIFEEAKQGLADQNVLKRGAEPAEIADAVVYLASEKSSFVTGIAMPIAAGQSVGL
ncbi:SDR family oxidoreductase [Pseudomonas sp. MPC6]|uniref:SDR family NAD(P)-dependent oxidoreductase n=1 Tax=unclassified Pseudomonas TaxID=196821 RepID=UPI0011109778|nr:SDR family oxidoreductase [Pseudomonas sp. MPC6]QCY09437.1 SDR family oxidoreductase [Pseudomonas sp. MPC6]